MKIIRDDQLFGLGMVPLLIDWNIRRCNVKGCTEKPNTIVSQLSPNVPLCGFCEGHYQEANKEGGAKFDLAFDDYDAFKDMEQQNEHKN